MKTSANSIQTVSSKTRCVDSHLFGSMAFVFLFTLLCCIGFSAMLGLPYPKIHDEFSYLLAGETFALARLTNRPHPMLEHFETMHVLQYPSYMSKYPPGQGLALAIGYRLGHPIYGVWLSLACACAAMTWAMSAVTEPFWACICGGLFAFSMNTSYYDIMWQIGYWAQSYWGGAVACLGGALALGSVLRFGQVSNGHPANDAALLTAFVLGLWLLAISRPLEGLLVAVPLSFSMLSLWIQSVQPRSVYSALGRAADCDLPKQSLLEPEALGELHLKKSASSASGSVGGLLARAHLKVLVVPLLVGISGAFWILHYQSSVTGSPFRLPYFCYEKRYALTPTFLAQPLRESQGYNNEPMRIFHVVWEAGIFRSQQNLDGYLAEKTAKLLILWKFFLGWSLTFPALFGFVAGAVALAQNRRSPGARLGWIGGVAVGLLVLVHSQTVWMNPHYMAPLVPILWCWIGQGLASLSSWTVFKCEVGLFLAIAFLGFAAMLMGVEFDTHWSAIGNAKSWQHQREEIEAKLKSIEGKHLVLIEYDASHSPHEEWCYNSADIDSSKIVWARDLGQAKNENLLRYFENRIVSKLAVGSGNAHLETVRDAAQGGR